MSWIDLVILAVLVWFAFAGLSAGLLRESVTLVAAIAGILIAGLLYRRLGDDLLAITDNQTVAFIAAFAAIFAAVFLAGQMAGIFLKRVAAVLMLGPIDSIAGMLFGFLKGFILVEGALILFTSYPVEAINRAMDRSLLTPIFLDGLPILLSILPREFREAVNGVRT